MSKEEMKRRLEVIHETLNTLDECHKQRQQFIQDNGVGILKNPAEAFENIDPDDIKDLLEPKKKKNFYSTKDETDEDYVPKKKRTILDGVQHREFKNTDEIWKDYKIKRFLRSTTTEGKRKIKEKKI